MTVSSESNQCVTRRISNCNFLFEVLLWSWRFSLTVLLACFYYALSANDTALIDQYLLEVIVITNPRFTSQYCQFFRIQIILHGLEIGDHTMSRSEQRHWLTASSLEFSYVNSDFLKYISGFRSCSRVPTKVLFCFSTCLMCYRKMYVFFKIQDAFQLNTSFIVLIFRQSAAHKPSKPFDDLYGICSVRYPFALTYKSSRFSWSFHSFCSTFLQILSCLELL